MQPHDIDWQDYLDKPAKAAQDLGEILHRGELALFVGAGISKGLGAPSWHSLARAMARDSKVGGGGINRKRITGGDLANIFTKIKRNSGNFDALLKKWLYYKWTKKSGNWASHTLVALGS